MKNTDDRRGASRITRTYKVTLPTGMTTVTIPQGYEPGVGGEAAKLRRLFPSMIGAMMVRG
jgi:hypothetical protein